MHVFILCLHYFQNIKLQVINIQVQRLYSHFISLRPDYLTKNPDTDNAMRRLPRVKSIHITRDYAFLSIGAAKTYVCHGFCKPLLLSRQITADRCTRTRRHCSQVNFMYHDRFLAPIKLVPRHCASAPTIIRYRDSLRLRQTCTATLVMLNKTCTRTAKSAPYPPLDSVALAKAFLAPHDVRSAQSGSST